MGDAARMEIRLAGLGGQGIVVAGALLGEAATLDGLAAAGSSSYGSQARGGACRADVVIGRSGFIDFPHVTRPRYLAVMSDEAYRAYLPGLAADGVILFDGYHVTPVGTDPHPHHEVAATRIALEALGKAQAANIVLLGALVGLTGIVGIERLREAVRAGFPERFHASNDRALDLGLAAGLRIGGGR